MLVIVIITIYNIIMGRERPGPNHLEIIMSKFNVSAVQIENGIISTDFFGKTESIKGFFADRQAPIEVFPVVGWKFSKIHLTHGTQENGSGFAFFKS